MGPVFFSVDFASDNLALILSLISCPHCQQAESVVKHGKTETGTQQDKYKECNKTFAINLKSKGYRFICLDSETWARTKGITTT
jgi:transposase-like protein